MRRWGSVRARARLLKGASEGAHAAQEVEQLRHARLPHARRELNAAAQSFALACRLYRPARAPAAARRLRQPLLAAVNPRGDHGMQWRLLHLRRDQLDLATSRACVHGRCAQVLRRHRLVKLEQRIVELRQGLQHLECHIGASQLLLQCGQLRGTGNGRLIWS